MGVRPGYKKTEVGVIPEEWQITQLQNVANVKTGPFGSALHERDYVEDGTPIITVEHLGEFGVAHSNLPMVSDADRQRLNAYSLKENDIVFSRVGSIDRNSLIRASEEGWLFSGRLLRIRPYDKDISSPYLSHYFRTESFKQRIRGVAVGQTMPSLNTQILNEIDVVLPPLPEQIAIAQALGDVDALISKMDELISKKRNIKQAAMQQLLTGRKRLPGFSRNWTRWRFDEVFEILRTASNPRSDLSDVGDIGYIHYGDIHSQSSPFLDCTTVSLPYIPRGKVNGLPLLEDGDLVMVDASEDYDGIGKSVELCNIADREVVAGLHTILFRGNKQLIADGFKGYLQFIPSVKTSLIRLATGISVYGISKDAVKSVEVTLPPLDEQRAIATILSDMDDEIAALEQKREKLCLIKQGMMQELLTGRVRLL